jgi:hypothetical protein
MRKASLAFVIALAACAQAKSGDVKTDAIYASISVDANGDGTSRARTSLKVGGSTSNTFLDLTDGDTLLASADTTQQVQRKESSLGVIWYDTTFSTAVADATYKISLMRTGAAGSCNATSAPNSHVTLPAPFTLTAPTAGSAVARTAAINVTWTGPAPEQMHLTAEGLCVQPFSLDVPGGATSATIAAGALKDLDAKKPASCEVTIALSRSRNGVLDPNYGSGGRITATQSRSLSITSSP